MNPYDELEFYNHVHRDAPIVENMEILFRGAKVAGVDFLPLYMDCLEQSNTAVGSWKIFRRAQRAITLARYFEHTLPLDGQRVECGVFQGFSTLLMARIARLHDARYQGEGLHAVDSFEGLSPPTESDALGVNEQGAGQREYIYSHQAGHFATPIDHVRNVMSEFPQIQIHRGWIPDAFSRLPQSNWAFVHIDVDLYAPTKASLEYFYPKLVPGAVIVNDDFGSPLFPGAARGWHEFFEARNLSYVILDTGQSIYIHE